MSEVTFFGEVTGLTSRAVDDSDDEDEANNVTSLDVAVTFQPEDLKLGSRARLFVSLVDHLPSGLDIVCDIAPQSSSGFTAKLIQLSDQQLWLAGRFSSPLLADSWQTVAAVDTIMQKLRPLISEVVILLVDRTVTSLKKISTASGLTDFGAKAASVPQIVGSTFEAAVFECCTFRNVPAQILLIPGSDCEVRNIPPVLFSSLRGLRLSAVNDSNMYT